MAFYSEVVVNMNNEEICKHCQHPVKIRNPSGFCDHLYYPENCPQCRDNKYYNMIIDNIKMRMNHPIPGILPGGSNE